MVKTATSPEKTPRTDRGRRTMHKLLEAAAAEFGERGFHDASISSITRRAGVALGSFYTYFDTKEAIFSSLVRFMSQGVAQAARERMTPGGRGVQRECEALTGFLDFARANKGIYRIIDEAEFIDHEAWLAHYVDTARRIAGRLDEGVEAGVIEPGNNNVRAWAFMGMSVFIGLRFAVLDESEPVEDIVAAVESLLIDGLGRRSGGR